MEIKNLSKTARRIQKAIRKGEKIILYADADLDGIASVIILKESIQNLGGKVEKIYFPDLEREGYGLHPKKLRPMRKKNSKLVITLDVGITCFEEVKELKKMGFEVIIIDHHEVLEKLPEASLIIDPKQKGDNSKFKELATAGIVFKLAQLLLREKLTTALKRNFLELVALASLYDMVPEKEDNKIFIEEGLSTLEETWRPGLKAFLRISEFQKHSNIREKAQGIVSGLSAAGYRNNLLESYLLLISSSLEKARDLAKNLLEKSYQRQRKIREIYQEVEELFLKKFGEAIIFEGSENWPLSLAGAVASRICNFFKKPTFIFNKGEKDSRGSVRTPQGIDSVALMKKCQKWLISFGGHPQASGFRIKNENLEEFRKCLINNLKHPDL